MEEIKISTVVRKIPVKLTNDENGEELEYSLWGMTGLDRDKYLNHAKNKVVMKDGKPEGMKNFDQFQSFLISKCLHDPSGKLVSIAEIEGYASEAQVALFEACQKMNSLGQDAEEDAKND